MSTPRTPIDPPAGNRRARLQQQRERAQREQQIRTRATVATLGVVALAIVGVLVWVFASAGRTAPVAGAGAAATGAHSVVVGDDEAPVTVDIYQDFMCPACGAFERANRDDLAELVDNGTARLEFHVMNFKDASSQGTRYSTRAANALIAIAKGEPDKVLAFNAALYDNQPDLGTPGLSDAEIADLARACGVSNDVIATFAQLANADVVTASNDAAMQQVSATPTVMVNGVEFDGRQLYTAGPLKAAVQQAAGQ